MRSGQARHVTDSHTPSLCSKLASEYDSRFEKTITQLVEEIQNRRYFISVDWVEEDSDDDAGQPHAAGDETTVRLLDYACGTGLISRVRRSTAPVVQPMSLPRPCLGPP